MTATILQISTSRAVTDRPYNENPFIIAETVQKNE